MTEDRPSDLLSALPRSRPHRRSDKRPARVPTPPEGPAPSAETTRAQNAPTRGKTAARGKAPASPKPARGSARTTRSARSPRSARAPTASSNPARTPAESPSGATPGAAQSSPRRRPHRLPQPAQPRGVPQAARTNRPKATTDFPVLRTALQAAGELTEIGLTLSAQVLRRAIGRFPRP